jgi:predicted tellurium resistance membrane protein TerC
LTLTALELVLGIDNIIFIAILVDKLPVEQQRKARLIGLFLAMFMRVGLLLMLSWIVGMTEPLFKLAVLNREISGRDLVLIGGGLFLIWKSTAEIHQSLEGAEGETASAVKARSPRSSCRSSSSTWCSRSTRSSPPSAWSTRSR